MKLPEGRVIKFGYLASPRAYVERYGINSKSTWRTALLIRMSPGEELFYIQNNRPSAYVRVIPLKYFLLYPKSRILAHKNPHLPFLHISDIKTDGIAETPIKL